MKTFLKILSIIAVIPLALIGGVLCGVVSIIVCPIILLIITITDIMEKTDE